MGFERKEGSVYEADDGVNWRQITVVTLLLTNHVNVGLLSSVTTGSTQGAFDNVLVQAQNALQGDDVVVEEVVGPQGGSLIKILYEDESDRFFPSGDAVVIIREKALKSESNIKFTISSENTTAYPDAVFFESLYPTDKISYIGPLATLEVPSASLNLDPPDDRLLFAITPSFYEGALDKIQKRDIRLEVRLPLADGDMVFQTLRFGYAGEAPIWSGSLKASYGDDLPEIVKISVQAVDISRAIPNPDDYLGP